MISLQILAVFPLLSFTQSQSCTPALTASSNTTNDFTIYKEATVNQDPYIYIGGLFDVHKSDPNGGLFDCGDIRVEGFQNWQAVVFAVEHFKASYSGFGYFNGINLGAIGFDSCGYSQKLIQNVLNLQSCTRGYGDPIIQPSHVLGYIGPETIPDSKSLVPVFQELGRTLISYSDNTGQPDPPNPYYFRSVPNDIEQIRAIVAMLLHEEWKHIQVVYGSDDVTSMYFTSLSSQTRTSSICTVNTVQMSTTADDADFDDAVDSLVQRISTRVVVVLLQKDQTRQLLLAADRSTENLKGKISWVGTSLWGNDPDIVKDVNEIAAGAVTLKLNAVDYPVPDFFNYFGYLKPTDDVIQDNPWFVEYWEDKFDCYLPGNPPGGKSKECDIVSESLYGTYINNQVAFTIRAVDSMLLSIGNAIDTFCTGPGLCSAFLEFSGNLALINDQVKEVTTKRGDRVFNSTTGDVTVGLYKYINYRGPHDNCPGHCYVDIGVYELGPNAIAGDLPVYHYRGNTQITQSNIKSTCPSSPCWECGEPTIPTRPATVSVISSTVEDPQTGGNTAEESGIKEGIWVIVLLILAGLGILLVLSFEVYLIIKMSGAIFGKHWRTIWLGQLLLLAILLCYVTLFAFVPVASEASCGIIRFAVGVTYAMCFSVLLVKLLIIVSSESLGYLKGIYQGLMFLFAWGVQIAVDATWLGLRPPGIQYNSDIGRNVCQHTLAAHVTSLTYVMLLIVICVLLAIRAHGIITNHRESVFIGIACGLSIPVFIVWILLALLHNNPEFGEPCIAFGLFITATIIFLVMFMPKVRQLNALGVEGIYKEDLDDSPEYAGSVIAPSILPPGSIITNNHVVQHPGVYDTVNPTEVTLVNAGLYSEPDLDRVDYKVDPDAIYLRHPANHYNTIDSHSIRSAPAAHHLRDNNIYATTRVVHPSSDLSGRQVYLQKPRSEYDLYGTTRSNRSYRSATLSKPKSLQDLGAL